MRTAPSSLVLGLALAALSLKAHSATYDMEYLLQSRGLAKASAASRAAAVEAVVKQMKPGDVLGLPRSEKLDVLDLSALPDRVRVEYGEAEAIYLGSGKKSGLEFLDVKAPILVGSQPAGTGPLAKGAIGQKGLVENSVFIGGAGIVGGAMVNAVIVDQTAHGRAVLDVKGQFENVKVFWISYHNNRGNPNAAPYIRLENTGDTKDSRIYQVVEHNYCDSKVQVRFSGVKNLYYGPGDTERSRSTEGVYELIGSENINLFGHRIFSGGRTGCSGPVGNDSYKILGGQNNRLIYSQDVGDPAGSSTGNPPMSLLANTSPNLQLWGTFFEDASSLPPTATRVFDTPYGMTRTVGKWTEPVQIDSSVVLSHKGFTIRESSKSITAVPADLDFPAPPSMPPMGINGMPKSALGKTSAAWGKNLIALGADPTGKKGSSAALQKAIASSRFVEIPKGTFLIDKPIELCPENPVEHIAGAGETETLLKATGSFPVFRVGDCKGRAALSKQGTIAAPPVAKNYSNITVEGGTYGIDVNAYGPNLSPGGKVMNCTFKGQEIAGIRGINGAEFDQVRVFNSTFEGADYGILLENSMIDKQGYLKCVFRGQKKAGIFTVRSMMFAGSIAECLFENINGPAIDFYPTSAPSGNNPPHCSMIISNRIKNCGNAQRAALDIGFLENGGLIDNKIEITDGRTIKYGFVGTGPYFDRCELNVTNGTVSEAAFGLRQPRLIRNARSAGSIVKDCKSNKGSVKFVYGDVENLADPSGVPWPLTPEFNGAEHDGVKWWKTADPSAEFPWIYSHLIYNSKFGDMANIDYALYRNAKSGKNLQVLPLKGAAVAVEAVPVGVHARTGKEASWSLTGRSLVWEIPGSESLPAEISVRNMTGREMYRVSTRAGAKSANLSRLKPGAYVISLKQGNSLRSMTSVLR